MALRVLTADRKAEAIAILEEIGADPVGIANMVPKMRHLNVRVPGIQCKAANIIKQDMLSLGGDAAVARGSVACSIPQTDVLLMGTEKQLRRAGKKFAKQPFGLKEVGRQLNLLLDHINRKNFSVVCKKSLLDLDCGTSIMGVLNVTPDSFSDGGRYDAVDDAVARAFRMVEEGAHILDIGGESTRPGADPLPLEEEIRRVIPVVERLSRQMSVPISVDTYKAEVARRALDAGADIINDISGLKFDADMAAVVADAGCPVVLMHIKGTPADMQSAPVYGSLMDEIIDSLQESIDIAEDAGISPGQIIVDPGIGFGKRFEDNLSLIREMAELKVLGKPILVGPSRKSFIGQLTGEENPEKRVEGTMAAALLSVAGGAHIIRVHDVMEAKKTFAVADAILKKG